MDHVNVDERIFNGFLRDWKRTNEENKFYDVRKRLFVMIEDNVL